MKKALAACAAFGALALVSGAQAATSFTLDFEGTPAECGGAACGDSTNLLDLTSGLPSWLASVTFSSMLSSWTSGYVGAGVVAFEGTTTFNPQAPGTITFTGAPGKRLRVVSFVLAPWNGTFNNVPSTTGYVVNGVSSGPIGPLSTATTFIAAGGGSNVTTFSFGPDAWTHGLDSITVAVVPEPSTWMLMIMGFGLIASQLRRRNRDALAA
jgi:hypothetical protein